MIVTRSVSVVFGKSLLEYGKSPFKKFSMKSFLPVSFNLKLLENNRKLLGNRKIHSTASFKSSLTCWKCGTGVEKDSEFALLVCPKCQSPQKLRGRDIPNYFELLGQEKTYGLDVIDMALKVKRLQRKLHPDLYAQKGEVEQELSQELSSLVNKAFGTLSNPIERGRYLLKLHGINSNDIEKEMTNDPKFLGEVMELNELLETLSSEKEWMDFRKQNQKTFLELQRKLEAALEKEDIKDAQIILGRMKYYDTLQLKLIEMKSKLGIVE